MSAAPASPANLIGDLRLPQAFTETVDRTCRPIAERIVRVQAALGRAMVVGVCGAQGTGKSTLAAFLSALLAEAGMSSAVLSIDDLYLSREARRRLGEEVHPLFRTRGVPGTHDIALGLKLIDSLTRQAAAHSLALPRFDKAADDPAPREAWPVVTAPVDVVVLEGWCVGARAQGAAALAEPVNALERDEDPDGRWRGEVNARLAGDYQRLFARIDLLVLLQAPGFEQVFAWRALQEQKLAERLAADGAEVGQRIMGDAELTRFIAHYERLTRHMLAEMPARADIVVELDPRREATAPRFRADPPDAARDP